MKKLNKVASLFATAALATSMSGAFAQVANPSATPTAEELKAANGSDQWRGAGGTPWLSGGGLCWRDNSWTPATAYPGCDGAAKPPPPAPVVAPAPAPAPAAPAPAPAPAAKPAPVSEKVTFAADAFFDFDKATLKPEGKAKLDDLASKMSGIALEVIIAVGHTDSVGNDAYNQKLSVARSEAVKGYLVSKGVEKNRVYTEGKGEKQPVADNKTTEGRAKNRRVEIEVVGTRSK